MRTTINTNEPQPQGSLKGGLFVIAIILLFIVGEAMVFVHVADIIQADYGYWPAVGAVSVLMIVFGLLFN